MQLNNPYIKVDRAFPSKAALNSFGIKAYLKQVTSSSNNMKGKESQPIICATKAIKTFLQVFLPINSLVLSSMYFENAVYGT